MKIYYILPLFLIAGCATITTGQNQSLSVITHPDQASCSLNNDRGSWYVDKTPGTVTVNRAYGNLSVTCKKDDLSGATSVKSGVKGIEFGNIFLGGIIGGAVDAGTGAAYDYPSIIDLPLSK